MTFGEDSLSEKDRIRLSLFVEKSCGIKMPPSKRELLEGRVSKRVRTLGMRSFKDYCDYLFSEDGQEREAENFINAISTNKTEFFREDSHFSQMREKIIPEILSSGQRMINIWSAACSSGEEVYSIAMTMEEIISSQRYSFDYRILGTDISTAVLEKAFRAVYSAEQVESVPKAYRIKYFMKGKGEKSNLVRVIPQIREKVGFKRLNFLEANYGVKKIYDIIFLRNALIYFERDVQNAIINNVVRAGLNDGGYFIIGHSETLMGFDTELEAITSTVYRYRK